MLTESSKDDRPGRPTTSAWASCRSSLASLVLAVSEGSTWGWTDAQASSARSRWRSSAERCSCTEPVHHDDPVIDPTLFQSRSFVLANSATVVYAAGFFAMLLGNILFLTGVWDYSIMRAGLAVTPGPIVVAIIAGPAGKLAARIGFRPVLLVGGDVLRPRPAQLHPAGRAHARLPRHVAARARCSSVSASGSRSPCSAPARCRRCRRPASPWAAP